MNKSPADGSVCRAFCGAVKCSTPRNLQKVLEFCQARCYDTTIKRAAKSPWAFYRFIETIKGVQRECHLEERRSPDRRIRIPFAASRYKSLPAKSPTRKK